jgi:hypothetical protein
VAFNDPTLFMALITLKVTELCQPTLTGQLIGMAMRSNPIIPLSLIF